MDKKKLEIFLSRLKKIEVLNVKLEQYKIEGNLAADILFKARNDIENKTVADFGCGNGILGIGALLIGANKVYFIDIDKEAIDITKENCRDFKNAEFLKCDISKFDKKIDTVIMNPPFGVRNRKADKIFLEKAFEFADNIYSIHKIESKKFLKKISEENGFRIEVLYEYNFLLRKSFLFHKKKTYNVKVGLWVMKRIK